MQTLYFPGTYPAESTLRRLLLFFEAVHCYQPMEGLAPAGLDAWTRTGFCNCYPPAPLGSDLERFKRLLKDLDRHGHEYYTGMLGSLSRQGQPDIDRETVSRLIAEVAGTGAGSEPASDDTEALWQARLLLALDERFSREQRDLEQGLLDLNRSQAGLFEALKGEDEDSELEEFAFVSAGFTKGFSQPPAATALLKAWGRLCLRDVAGFPACLATDRPAAADRILETVAKHGQTQAVRLAVLPVPDLMAGQPEDLGMEERVKAFMTRRAAFRAAADSCLTGWAAALAQVMAGTGPAAHAEDRLAAIVSQPAAEWTRLVRDQPQAEPVTLTIYLLPTTTWRQVFQKLVPDATQAGRPPEPAAGTSLLAVLG